MIDPPSKRASLLRHLKRQIRVAGDPLEQTSRPMEREAKRIVIGVGRNGRVAALVIGGSNVGRVPVRPLVIGLPEKLTAGGHVAHQRKLQIVRSIHRVFQLHPPVVRSGKLPPAPVVNAESPENWSQRLFVLELYCQLKRGLVGGGNGRVRPTVVRDFCCAQGGTQIELQAIPPR